VFNEGSVFVHAFLYHDVGLHPLQIDKPSSSSASIVNKSSNTPGLSPALYGENGIIFWRDDISSQAIFAFSTKVYFSTAYSERSFSSDVAAVIRCSSCLGFQSSQLSFRCP
ncbi:MAG: uncharacterized protein A8A55_3150, partial [Amphiamblys sp. WSBS2006]